MATRNALNAELDALLAMGVTAKEILDAAKEMYSIHAGGPRDASLPMVRCRSKFRKETEECASRVDKTLTEYIMDAVCDSNYRLL